MNDELVEVVMDQVDEATLRCLPRVQRLVVARYVLSIANRAAMGVARAYRLDDAPGSDEILAMAVRGAVEGA